MRLIKPIATQPTAASHSASTGHNQSNNEGFKKFESKSHLLPVELEEENLNSNNENEINTKNEASFDSDSKKNSVENKNKPGLTTAFINVIDKIKEKSKKFNSKNGLNFYGNPGLKKKLTKKTKGIIIDSEIE